MTAPVSTPVLTSFEEDDSCGVPISEETRQRSIAARGKFESPYWSEAEFGRLRARGEDYPSFLNTASFARSDMAHLEREQLHETLRLKFVFGASMKGCKGSLLHINREGRLCYPAAGCGVAYNHEARDQIVFNGHTDNVTCMDMHPNRNIVATGQTGLADFVAVWDSTSGSVLTTLDTGKYFRNGGVFIVAFSPSGKHLACIGGSPQDQQVLIYEWKSGKLVAKDAGYGYETYGFRFHAGKEDSIVWTGKNTIKFLKVDYAKGTIEKKNGILRPKGETQNCYAAAFDTKGQTYIGTRSGQVYIFRENTLIDIEQVHPKEQSVYCIERAPTTKEETTNDNQQQ